MLEGAAARFRGKGARHMGKTKHRLLYPAVVGTVVRSQVARFFIHQNGGDHRLHITTHSLAVILEDGRYTLYVGWTGMLVTKR